MAKVRSNSFSLLVAPMTCWSCHRQTRVGLLSPAAQVQVLDDEEDGSEWTALSSEVVLTYVSFVDTTLQKGIAAAFPMLRLDDSNTVGARYWMNHCEQCEARIGEHFIHSDPDGPFFAWPRAAIGLARIELGAGTVDCSLPYVAG